MKHKLLILLSLLICSGEAIAQLSADEERGVQALMTEMKIPGMSLAIIQDGEIVYSKGIGEKGDGDMVDDQTLFQTASLSKFPVALWCLLNVQQGAIDIDLPVNQYLNSHQLKAHKSAPDITPTIKQVLSHTAGINLGGFLGYKRSKKKIPTIENVLDGKHTHLWEPKVAVTTQVGLQYEYSGGGYSYLQKMIADFKGDTFSNVMKQELFTLLQMDNSYYGSPTVEANIALAHNKKGKVIKGGYRLYPQEAAAGLWSTAADYAQLLLAVICADTSAMITQASIAQLITPTQTSDGMTNDYGLGVGLELDDNLSVTAIRHSGQNLGYKTFFYLNLADKSGYVILTNRHKANLGAFGKMMKEHLAK